MYIWWNGHDWIKVDSGLGVKQQQPWSYYITTEQPHHHPCHHLSYPISTHTHQCVTTTTMTTINLENSKEKIHYESIPLGKKNIVPHHPASPFTLFTTMNTLSPSPTPHFLLFFYIIKKQLPRNLKSI